MRLKSQKWKKLVSALIAVGLILTGIPMPGSVSIVHAADVEDDGILYSEDFENDSYLSSKGNSLIDTLGFATNAADEFTAERAVLEVVADEDDTDNQVLKIGYHKGSTQPENHPHVKKDLSNIITSDVKKVVLSYRIKSTDVVNQSYLFLPRLQSGSDVMNNAHITGPSLFEQGTRRINIVADTWHKIEVIIDAENGKYDMYMDGTALGDNACIASQLSTGTTDTIDSLFIEPARSATNDWYLDDITISKYVEPTSVSFANAPAELTVGNSAVLSLTYEPANADVREMAFSSSNDAVAMVDATGKVTAVGVGEVTITATPTYTKSGNAGDGIPFWGQLTPATTTINVKAAQVLEDGVLYSEDFEDDSLSSKGTSLISTLGFTTNLTETEFTDGKAVFEVVADADDADNQVLKIGYHKGASDRAENSYVKYDLSEIITQDTTKVVLSYRMKSAAEKSAFYPPRFQSENEDLNSILIAGQEFYVGAIRRANFKANTWSKVEVIIDTETGIYDVYADGTTQASGACACIAAQESGKSGTIKTLFIEIKSTADNDWYLDDITVTKYVEPTSVSFADAPTELAVGNSAVLSLAYTPTNADVRDMAFSSSNDAVATVDKTGKVTAVGVGEVTITATPTYTKGSLAGDATPFWGTVTPVTTTIMVREPAVTGITVDNVTNNAITLPEGGHMYLQAKTLPDETEILYSSDNESVVTVDEWGEIVAVGAGTANITLQSTENFLVTCTIAVTVEQANDFKTIYVSPTGSSTGEGSSSDKVTIQRAMELVAANNDNMTGNIKVILDDGYYQQTDTIAFTEAHSGTNNYSVIWCAAEGAEPVIGGGIHLAGSAFTACTEEGLEGVYVATVPDYVQTRQLYVNNVRATRARSEGSLLNPVFDKSYGYICDNTELLDYKKITDLELVWYQNWTNSRCGVASVEETDDDKVKLTMDQPGWSNVTDKGSATNTGANTEIAWYENALELLDEPGEWYLDEEADKLYYMPRQWENDMADVTITIPVVEDLVTISGSDNHENMVQNIHFEGITFADTTWMRPSTNMGHCEMQNNHLRENASMSTDRLPDAAITVKKANSIYFTDCTFTRMGITALKMVEGVQNSPVSDSHFYDISGSAITIGEPGIYTASQIDNYYPSDIRKMMKNCDVLNNYIHNVAVEYKSAAAVSVGFAANMDLSYNEIFNIPYSGYHIGYGWADVFKNVLKNMVISHNFIHDIMESEVYDGGAIYTLGNSGDGDGSYNQITGNYIKKQGAPQAPLYSDNGSTYWKLIDNVVDMSEVEEWTLGNNSQRAMKWGFVNAPADQIHYTNIYTTIPGYTDYEGDTTTYENIVACDAANWPAEAVAIMNAAGLQGNDAAARRNGQAERIVTNLTEEITLGANEVFNITVSFTDGRDAAVTGGVTTVYYDVEDSSIAEVSSTGVITSKATGITTVRLYVVSNDILDVIEGTLYVGDELKEVKLTDIEDGIDLVAGTTGKQLKPYLVTEMGRNPEITEVTYTIADTTVATVDENGFLKPLASGETTLTVTATDGGETVTNTFVVTITDGQTFDGLLIHDAAEMFMAEMEDTWVTQNKQIWEFEADTQIATAVYAGYATFGGAKYGDELLQFRLNISAGGTWPSLVFRAQDTSYRMSGAGSTGYMFCVKEEGLELHRWNDGVRTCIYGDSPSFAPNGGIGGHIITPHPITYNEDHDVIIGAVNVEDGVRIILVVDGVTIVDYVDTQENAITNEGYFGVVGSGRETFTLTKMVDENDGGGGETPTPTPTPEASATPTPTPEASATPTPTPEASATPTSTPEASATPTPTPEASATPLPSIEPEIILEGTDKSYTKGANATVSIHCTGDLDDLIGVKMDGKEVAETNYTVKEGSTIVTFKAEYLETLSVGDHTVTLLYEGGGSVDSTLTILAAVDDSTDNTQNDADDEGNDTDVSDTANTIPVTEASKPSTGDNSNLILWMMLFLATAIGACAYLAAKKRHN